jgi:hypothetical protein
MSDLTTLNAHRVTKLHHLYPLKLSSDNTIHAIFVCKDLQTPFINLQIYLHFLNHRKMDEFKVLQLKKGLINSL